MRKWILGTPWIPRSGDSCPQRMLRHRMFKVSSYSHLSLSTTHGHCTIYHRLNGTVPSTLPLILQDRHPKGFSRETQNREPQKTTTRANLYSCQSQGSSTRTDRTPFFRSTNRSDFPQTTTTRLQNS